MKLPPAFKIAVAATMSALRAYREVTQDQMARLVGVDQASLSLIERALRMPSIAVVWRVGVVAEIELWSVAAIICDLFTCEPETIDEGRDIALKILDEHHPRRCHDDAT